MQQSVFFFAEMRQGVSKEVRKSPCGCLSSFGGFLYAAACKFATMFTCPVDHHIFKRILPR